MPRAADPTLRLTDLAKQLQQENDRGAAILVAAFADELLRRLIETRFRKTDELADGLNSDVRKSLDSFMKPEGPLGSFAARIKLAYLLSLVTAREFLVLEQVRRIRNFMAHRLALRPFTDTEVAKCCKKLGELGQLAGSSPVPGEPGAKGLRFMATTLLSAMQDRNDPRSLFIAMGAAIVCALLISLDDATGDDAYRDDSNESSQET